MTRPVRLPTSRTEIEDLKRRVYDLERRIKSSSLNSRPTGPPEIFVFNYNGALTASESDRYYPLLNSNLSFVLLSLSTAGSSSTVVDVNRNGSQIAQVTLASSDQFEVKTLGDIYDVKTDYLTFEVTTVGTGAAGLVCQGVFL